MWNNNERTTDRLMHNLVMSDGVAPEIPDKPMTPPTRQQELVEAFSVKLDSDNNIIRIQNNDPNTEDEIRELTEGIIYSGNNEGKIDDYKYLVEEKEYGRIIVFVNQSIQDQLLKELKYISYIIGIISIVILSIIILLLSKLVTKPIEISFEKQKRFVSDSGHELRTPLSILSANADMMEMELGNNEWLTQIKHQSSRMSKLIHELLTLAKTEDINANNQFIKFNLSQTILNTVLPLEMIAFEQNRKIVCNIEDNVLFDGNEKKIVEMLEALMDNAIKYSDENSTILVNLSLKGNKKVIEVCNKSNGFNEKEKLKLFDKFYRADDSRARETGGYGLGLSIVKNIVDIHKGKIEIDTKSNELIIFRITLS